MLSQLSLLLICLSFSQNRSALGKNLRIAGGQPADITEFPYQVSVVVSGMHLCGGSIISKKYIVTAAACVDGETIENVVVQAGSSLIGSKEGSICALKQIFEHPQFSLWNYENDIAILELKDELTLSDTINIVNLPDVSEDVPTPGTEALISGWGLKQNGTSEMSTQLLKATVEVFSLYKCLRYYPYGDVTERMICAESSDGKHDSCSGDSGGPLVVGKILYGVVSWGYSCGKPNHPGVYTSVISMRDFIKTITGL